MLLRPDTVDEAFVASGDERRELRVEPFPGRRSIQEPQVHSRQPVDAQRGEVLLDAGAQLVRVVVGQHSTAIIATSGHLAHDRQGARVREQGFTDQLVHDTGSVVLRGVDVVDPAIDRGA